MNDVTIGEALNIKISVIPDTDRPLPDTYHARLGNKLDPHKSKVYDQIFQIKKYSETNGMKLTISKNEIHVI